MDILGYHYILSALLVQLSVKGSTHLGIYFLC